jgi:hypothetical protein
VLDAVDPRPHRLVHRGQPVRVRGDRKVEGVRLFDHQRQLIGRVLAARHIDAGGVDAAAGHDLDDVHLVVCSLLDRLAPAAITQVADRGHSGGKLSAQPERDDLPERAASS